MPPRKTRTLKYFLRESLIALVSSPLCRTSYATAYRRSVQTGIKRAALADGTLAFIYYTFALIVSVMVVASPPEGMPAWTRPPHEVPVRMRPPNANQARPGPAAIPTAITGIMAINELRGLLVLTIAAALTDCSHRYRNRESNCESAYKQEASRARTRFHCASSSEEVLWAGRLGRPEHGRPYEVILIVAATHYDRLLSKTPASKSSASKDPNPCLK